MNCWRSKKNLFYHVIIHYSCKEGPFLSFIIIKLETYSTLNDTCNSYFCVTPPKNHRLMFVSWKYYKALSQKKVIVCFYNLKLLNVAAFVIFPTSIMFFFEILKRFKGDFLNELRVSFKGIKLWRFLVTKKNLASNCV